MKTKTSSPTAQNHSPLLPFRSILVPTDFSEGASQAFAAALELGRRFDAEVHLLHVIGSLEGDAYSPLRFTPEAHARKYTPKQMVNNLLRSIQAKHDTAGLRITRAARYGSSVTQTLLQYVEQAEIDLIVMSTHGRHGIEHFFMGSVAERTVRHAPCSVLTLHQQDPREASNSEAPKLPIQRMLVPVDFSRHATPLLRAAHQLSLAYEAEIDLLHVVEPVPFLGAYTGVLTMNDLFSRIAEETGDTLQQLWEKITAAEIQPKLHLESGHPAARIVDFAAKQGSDLIVLASQGHSNVARFLLGSVAERVVQTATCPVLTLKTQPTEGGAKRPAASAFSGAKETVH